jgi:hypothetical protein
MMSVQMGGTDLKGMISQRSILGEENERLPGEPDEMMYLKQANHYIGKCKYEEALKYVRKSLQYNSQSKVFYC